MTTMTATAQRYKQVYPFNELHQSLNSYVCGYSIWKYKNVCMKAASMKWQCTDYMQYLKRIVLQLRNLQKCPHAH